MFIVVVVGSVTAFSALRAHQRFFADFIRSYRQESTAVMAELLSAWYEQARSWDEVGRAVLRRSVLRSPERILIMDQMEQIVLDTQPERALPSISTWKQWATPVTVDGRVVGHVLLLGRVEVGLLTLEEVFTNSVRNATLLGGVLGVFLAALLALWWSTPVSRRLAELERASRRLAQRDWQVRVEHGQGDELDEVGQAFNFMAESLDQSERARRNLVADIAHELRTPLSVLRGNLEAVQEGVLQARPELIASLVDETVTLSQLVSDLQELSLAEAQALRMELALHSPHHLVGAAVSAVVWEAKAKRIEMRWEIPEDLPPVWADGKRVHQILLNLLRNALRHTPEGGTIEITAWPRESDVVFSLRDSGPGLRDDELEAVFERFYGRGRERGESGLGLAIARGLVEAQGGRIWAQQPAQLPGAQFCFTLCHRNDPPVV